MFTHYLSITMKKLLFSVLLISIHFSINAQQSDNYKTAIGLQAYLGKDYGALLGVSAKHFFTKHGAFEARLLYGSPSTLIGLEYQYHGRIIQGLKWYAGIGPSFVFTKEYKLDWNYNFYYASSTHLILAPVPGLDYKFSKLPINVSIDWRPSLLISSSFTVFEP